MLAAVTDTKRKELVVRELQKPKPESDQLLAKCLACGICGSDLHMLQNGIGNGCVFGHEFVCEVSELGPGAESSGIAVGDRVCCMPMMTDSKGRERFVGGDPKYPGGYSQYLLLNPSKCVKVPPHLSDDEAAVTEPMAVALHAVNEAQADPKDIVPIVYGCGPVGLCTVIVLKALGFAPVIAVNRSAFRRNLAKEFGADIVIDPTTENPFKAWRRAMAAKVAMRDAEPREESSTAKGSDSVDANLRRLQAAAKPPVVFENVGTPGMLQRLGELAPPRSKLVICGVCMEPDTIQPALFVNKQLTLVFVVGYTKEEFAGALQYVAERKPDVRGMITAQVGLAGVTKAFEALSRPERHAKILVKPFMTAQAASQL